MKVVIELVTGPKHQHHVCQADVQKNIDALYRCVEGRKTGADDVLLIDTISILTAIRAQLTKGGV